LLHCKAFEARIIIIKKDRLCFSVFPNTIKRTENTMHSGIIETFSCTPVILECGEALSLVLETIFSIKTKTKEKKQRNKIM